MISELVGVALIRLLDWLMERRIEVRRRLPVVRPENLNRCVEVDANGRRCVLDRGHAEQHRLGPTGRKVPSSPDGRLGRCTASCLPSCSYPKCWSDR